MGLQACQDTGSGVHAQTTLGTPLPLLKMGDWLGCPSVDTPACPPIFILLGAGAPAWLRAVPILEGPVTS